MNAKQSPILAEVTEHTTLPALSLGGYLEPKEGKLLLRLDDQIEAKCNGGYRLTRRWQRGPHNRDYYPEKPQQEDQP